MRWGYETTDLPTNSSGAPATGGTVTNATRSTSVGANGGTASSSQTSNTAGNSSGTNTAGSGFGGTNNPGASSLGGTNGAGGSSSPTSVGGYTFGGASNAGGSNGGTGTGGYAFGGASNTGGNDSRTSAGGYAFGGASNVGSSNAGTSVGGYTFGGASNAGGSNGGTGTGGYAFGGASNTGGNDSRTSAGGYAFGGVSNAGGSDGGTSTGGDALGGTSNAGGNSSGTNAGGAGNGGTTGAATGGGTQTAPSTLGDCCRFTNVAIIEGSSAGDTLLAVNTASALANACGTSTTTRQISQDAPGVLDVSGRPLIGPTELVLMSGGFVTQKAVAYLDQNDTPIYASLTARNNRYTAFTRAGYQVFSIKTASFTTSYDVAIIAVTYEPISRTFVLDVYGFNSVGTGAGIFYFANTLAPSLKGDTNHYYVVEWTDVDGDQNASAGDRYVLLASG